MDYIQLIADVLFGGTSIFAVATAIRYRKENKELKKLEVKSASSEADKGDIEVQQEKLNLGDAYLEKVMAVTELAYKATLKNNEDILSTTKQLGEKMDSVQRIVKDIVEYLDGDFDKHLKEKYGKA